MVYGIVWYGISLWAFPFSVMISNNSRGLGEHSSANRRPADYLAISFLARGFYSLIDDQGEPRINCHQESIIGQRGKRPVQPLGYVNFSKVIFSDGSLSAINGSRSLAVGYFGFLPPCCCNKYKSAPLNDFTI